MTKPLISVITVVYNNRSGLQRTFESVFNQTAFDQLEYLVIDGGSTDGTVALIQAASDKIKQWVSEKDKGLYDAMNKGLAMANGDYVWFMNSGDAMFDNNAAASVIECIKRGADFIYGDTMFITPEEQEIGLMSKVTPKKLPSDAGPETFAYGMNICHQSVVVRRDLAPAYQLQYRMVADIDWIVRILKQKPVSRRLDRPLAKFELGGISQQRIRTSWKERFRVLVAHYGFVPTLFRHIIILFRNLVFQFRSTQ
jgi:glycosyltransferase involved in cell wall biosynthesis